MTYEAQVQASKAPARTTLKATKKRTKRVAFGKLVNILRRAATLRGIQIFCLRRSGNSGYDQAGDLAKEALAQVANILPTLALLAFPKRHTEQNDMDYMSSQWERFQAEFPRYEDLALRAFRRLQGK